MKISTDAAGDLSANILTGNFDISLPDDIFLYDNTLREGEQAPGVAFTTKQKIDIATKLEAFGVQCATVGFPAAGKAEFESTRALKAEGLKMKMGGLSRLKEADILRTIDTGVDVVALFLGSSDSHLHDKIGWSEKQAIDEIHKAVGLAKDNGAEVTFALEDGTRAPLSRVINFGRAVADAGADVLVFADTAGILTPASTFPLVQFLTGLLPIPIAAHFHNDMGLACANSLSAIQGGAKYIQGTMNGVGERCGNTCLAELAVVLRVKYELDLGMDLSHIQDLSDMVHRASGTKASPHKAVTGKWAFTHESGIHVAGILANPETYQPYPPGLVGRSHELVFGKHSGIAGLKYLAENEGLEVNNDDLREVLDRVKEESVKNSAQVSDDVVAEWLANPGQAKQPTDT